MGKHTEGRWEASVTQEFGCEVKANGEDIAWVLSNKPEDAHLMASAPDLLEALELADAALSGANMNMNVVERKVKAAIARARGEE